MEFDLPEEWEVKNWGEVLTITNGKSQKGVVNENGEYPIYGSGGIMGHANEYLCEGGSTIIGRKGTINNPLFVETKFWNVDTAFGLTSGEKLDSKFLYYFCKGYNFLSHNKSTTLPSLTKSDLLKIQIPLPPLPEQTRIVAKLDALFERIDKAIALLEENIKKTGELMEAVLGEVFEELELGPKKAFKSLCEKLTDGTHFSPKNQFSEHKEGFYKYITSKNIKWSGLNLDNVSYLSKEVHEDIYKRCNPEFGDLLITKDGAMTGTCCINTLEEPFSLLSSVALAKPNKKLITSKFLYFFFKSPQGRDRIFQDISGAAITRTTIAKLNLIQIPVIDLIRQNQVVQHLENCEKITNHLISAQSQKLRSLKVLKSSLLDQAFRGKL